MKIITEIILAMSVVYQKQVHNFKKCRATIAQADHHHFKPIKVHLQYLKYKERRCKKIRRQRESNVKLNKILGIDFDYEDIYVRI